jgi:hypothetical protein
LFVGLDCVDGHRRLGTVPGTFGAFSIRSVQKTERKRREATVSLTVALFQ